MTAVANVPCPFEYQVIRSKRKTAAIHVSAKGVQVRIPDYVSDEFAHDFVLKKARWVQTKLAAQAENNKLLPQLQLGEQLHWLGSPFPIVYSAGKKLKLIKDDQRFLVEGPKAPTQKQMMTLFSDYFKQQAKAYLVNETLKQAQRMNLAHKLDSVTFRRTKSKWGHCTSKGVIQYNWLIMGAPEYVIQYLVVHEVAHLKYPHHQPNFWGLVETYCRDYKKANAWLKQQGIKLSWC